MTTDVKITVSLEVAQWLEDLVQQAAPGGDPFSPMLRDVNQYAALNAIQSGIRQCSIRPRTCHQCGKSIYVNGYGRPAKFCSDRCRVASYRDRVRAPVSYSPGGGDGSQFWHGETLED